MRQQRAKSAEGTEKQNRERYKDTIIAIGYAERQMAETLKMAGKVKVEL